MFLAILLFACAGEPTEADLTDLAPAGTDQVAPEPAPVPELPSAPEAPAWAAPSFNRVAATLANGAAPTGTLVMAAPDGAAELVPGLTHDQGQLLRAAALSATLCETKLKPDQSLSWSLWLAHGERFRGVVTLPCAKLATELAASGETVSVKELVKVDDRSELTTIAYPATPSPDLVAWLGGLERACIGKKCPQ